MGKAAAARIAPQGVLLRGGIVPIIPGGVAKTILRHPGKFREVDMTHDRKLILDFLADNKDVRCKTNVQPAIRRYYFESKKAGPFDNDLAGKLADLHPRLVELCDLMQYPLDAVNGEVLEAK